jgi:HEAT repeat protein
LISGIPPVRVNAPDLSVLSPVLTPLDAVWRRMTEWEPERRYQSAEDALEDVLLATGAVLGAIRGVAGARHPELKGMITLLRSNNGVQRERGIELAVRLGTPALTELHSLLGHNRRDVRDAAAVALGRIGDLESVPFLVAGLYGTSDRASNFRPASDAAVAALGE